MLRIVANVLQAKGAGPIVYAVGLAVVGAVVAWTVAQLLDGADGPGAG